MCLPITTYYANACGHQALAGSRESRDPGILSQFWTPRNALTAKIAKIAKLLTIFYYFKKGKSRPEKSRDRDLA